MRRTALALVVLVALGGALVVMHLRGGKQSPQSLIACPLNAPGWRGRITGPQLSASAPAQERRIAELVNLFRRQHGRRPLRTSTPLALAARAHDADMDRRDYFAHERPGLSFERRLARYTPASCIAENIAWGTGSFATPAATVQAWRESPEHRKVMLLPWTRRIGVGVHRSATGFQDVPGAIITTADFSG